MAQFIVYWSLALQLVQSTCSGLPDRVRRADFVQRHGFEYLLNSPSVVIGTIVAVADEGQPVASREIPELSLRRKRVTIHVETSLKGNVPPGLATFCVFTFHDGTFTTAPLFDLERGQRYIFALDREQGTLRSFGDVFDYSLPVFAGDLRNWQAAKKSLAEELAEILLEIRAGYKGAAFCAELTRYRIASEYLVGMNGTRRLIQELRQHPDRTISRCADEQYRFAFGPEK